MTKRLTGVSDWPYATTCPGVTLRSTTTPPRGALTTIVVAESARAAISASCSAETPSVCRREAARSSSATAFRASFSASRSSFCATAWASKSSRLSRAAAAGAGGPRPAPASMKSARTASRIVTLVPQRAADGSFELVQRGPEVAHRTEMLERRLAVGPLGVEEVEEAGAPPTVRELDGRTGLLRLRQVGIAQHDDPVALDRHRGQRGIDLGERLDS